MSLSALRNPFTSLKNLESVMSWSGVFDPNVSYFKNDIVVSPITLSSYILNKTSSSGQDPSLGGGWTLFGLSGGGVQVAKGSTYIDVSGSGTNPTVSNLGVIETILTYPLYNSGDAQNLIIDSDCIATIQQGTGISVNGTEISNLGVGSSISGGTGIQVDFDPNLGTANVTNTGVVEIQPADQYITVTGPKSSQTIGNGGILNIIAGSNLTNIGTSTDPKIQNDGVITLTSPTNTVVNTGTVTRQKLSAAVPILTRCFESATFNKSLSSSNYNLIWYDLVQDVGLFQTCLEGGTPYSTGVFYIDLSYLLLVYSRVWWVGATAFSSLLITFYDGATTPGTLFQYTLPIAGNRFTGPTPNQPGAGTSPCKVAFDLAVARTKGLRAVTSISIDSPFVLGPKLPVATGSIFGIYYPNGRE